jgi:spore coat protein A
VSDPAIAVNRAAPHLHGGLVPWPSDGGPFHWFSSTRNGAPRVTGSSVVSWLPDGNGSMTDDYWYPNVQTPRFMWYHDHAVGITRLNAYAGLASGYILTGPAEATLMSQLAIPPARQIPLVVQDKVFQPNGKLWYPDFYDTEFFSLDEDDAELPLPSPSLVPEFWGDTMLVNGTVYPYLDVEPRRYRLRILNACNTRFLSLRLLGAAGRTFPDNTEADAANPGPTLLCIGTEGGLLDGTVVPKGVMYDNTGALPLVLGPAERADIIVDFSKVKTSSKDPLCFVLYNDAPVPFPGGTPLADFHPRNRRLAPPPSPGYGPNTRTLLQFRVLPLGAVTGDTNPDAAPDPTWMLPPTPVPAQTVPMPRDLALFETVDVYGRLAQQLGPLSGPLEFTDPATEVVQAGTVEVWRIFNVSADTHPIHFHYFNVRVVSRQRFRLAHGRPVFNGAPEPPEPGEQGWKETVRMNPGECTTLLAEMPSTAGLAPPGVSIPDSPRTAGHEYVWHCHILEHEEHDMMRPLIVMP